MRASAISRPTEITHITPAGRSTTQLAQVAIERFDDYVIVAKVGQGGMAEVFLALEQGPGAFRKLLVVKRLFAHLSEDPHVVQMFMHEASLAARLHHPNIVQTNKVGECHGQHFLAMEYLEGQPLHRVHQRLRSMGETLPPVLAARVAAEVLEGLAYAHELGDYDGTPLEIVHRDVSPQNVFVTYDGQVKLLDFGIAKAALAESHTRTGLIKGKFSYIAPEQARGETVDLRADLWSMGVTLWESLSGERPFKGANEVAVLRSVLTEELPDLSEVAPHVPPELSRIVARALTRDRELRFRDARAFRAELVGWLRESGADDGRAATADLMRALFGDKLEERRETVRRCVAQVERESSQPPPLPVPTRTSALPALSAAPRRSRKGAVAVGLAVLACAGAALALRAGTGTGQVAPAPSASAGVSEGSHADSAALAAPVAPAPQLGRSPTTVAAPMPGVPEPAAPVRVAPSASAAPMHPRKTPVRAQQEVRTRVPAPRPTMPAPVSPVAPPPEASAASAPEVQAKQPGRLVLDASPYAVVTLDGKKLGITPLEVELPAATHTLVLKNPERGIQTTYRVTIPPGERITRRIALE